MTNGLVIQTESLGKSYGSFEAVKELNLSIRPNTITAFLGLNGAGKSTTIKMLLGMMQPTTGDGTILGQRISDPVGCVRTRSKIAYVSENKRTLRLHDRRADDSHYESILPGLAR